MQANWMDVTVIGLAIVIFASTNIDDVFVLLGFFADPQFSVRDVVAGQYIGLAALFMASLVAALISLAIPPAYIGILGWAPIAIGTKRLFDLWRGHEKNEEELKRHPSIGTYGRTFAVATVTIANGGDNIGVYTPVFATCAGYQLPIIAIVFAAMTALWCLFAHWLVKHPSLGAPLRQHGHRIVPFILIALGARILLGGHIRAF
jgi:cadmium resistance protein CadD (predicted permease)